MSLARQVGVFRCASISWFQAVSGWVSNLPFSASASTGLSDYFGWNDISLIKVNMKLWVASHSSKQIDASIRIIDFTQAWKNSVSIYILFFMKYFLANTLDVFLLQVESCLWCFLTHFWERGRKCIAWWFPRGTPPLLYLRPMFLAILQ